jgi:multiple sugar transport system substrate-binding protein
MKDKDKDARPLEGERSEGNRKGVSRRRVMQTATAVGLSGTALGGLMKAVPQAKAAGFDPMKYKGTELNMLLVPEGEDKVMVDLMPQFEAETGMKLNITAPAVGPLIEKTLQNLKADKSGFEIINYLGFLTTQQVGGGYFTQLNDLISNADETPPDWDFDDFIPGAVKNVGYFDLKNKGRGQGKDLYGIPGMHSGSVIYFYRKDLFDAAGLKPAKTWDEFRETAKKLHSDKVAGCSFIGKNDFSLAFVEWYTRFITNGGVLMSGDPNGTNFKPNVNSPEGILALQLMIDCLPYAPKNVTQYAYTENVDGFSTGKIAQMIFWSTIAGPVFDKSKSLVADKTGTAAVPAAAGQKPSAIQGGWGLGIPKNVDPAKKMAAWRALTWLTSKKVNKYEVEKYQIDASRQSTFKDPDLLKQFPYLTDSAAAIANASTLPTSNIPETFPLNDIMNVEFSNALLGQQDAKTACANVQTQWEAVLRKGGHLI